MDISFTRPNLAISAPPSVYRVIRDNKQFEIIVDEELSDRGKEALRFQFTLQQSELLDGLLGSNLEFATFPNDAIRILSSDSYNLPIPTPISTSTLFLRDEIIRFLGVSLIGSLINDKDRNHIESFRAKQMEIGIWLYRLPKKYIDFMLK